jgi:hypothetical protein
MTDVEVHLMGDFGTFTSSINRLCAKERRDSNENECKDNPTDHDSNGEKKVVVWGHVAINQIFKIM